MILFTCLSGKLIPTKNMLGVWNGIPLAWKSFLIIWWVTSGIGWIMIMRSLRLVKCGVVLNMLSLSPIIIHPILDGGWTLTNWIKPFLVRNIKEKSGLIMQNLHQHTRAHTVVSFSWQNHHQLVSFSTGLIYSNSSLQSCIYFASTIFIQNMAIITNTRRYDHISYTLIYNQNEGHTYHNQYLYSTQKLNYYRWRSNKHYFLMKG